MDTRKTIDSYTQFSSMFAPLLSKALEAKGGAVCSFASASAPTPEQATGEPAVPAGEGSRIAVLMRFDGALTGHCAVVLAAEDAKRLAGEGGEPKVVLATAIQHVCEAFSASLSAYYGSVRVHYIEDETLPDDAVAAAWLSATLDDGALVLVELSADSELQRGLTRLARVAAAAEASGLKSGNLGLVMDVELNVTLRFGQRQLSLREVMELASGSVVELDREVDEPVDLILDGRVIARGEAVIVDGNYGVRVTEVMQPVAF